MRGYLLLLAGVFAFTGNGAWTRVLNAPASLAPAGVTDLKAQALSDSALVLTWTDVPSGLTVPARYAVRVDTIMLTSDFAWASRPDITTGGCAAPLIGANAAGGKPHACVLSGLRPNRLFFVQLISYTGTLNTNAVFGPRSNVARATTMQRLGTMLVWRDVVNHTDSIHIAEASLPYDFGPTRFPVRGTFPPGDRVASFWDSTGALTARAYCLLVRP